MLDLGITDSPVKRSALFSQSGEIFIHLSYYSFADS